MHRRTRRKHPGNPASHGSVEGGWVGMNYSGKKWSTRNPPHLPLSRGSSGILQTKGFRCSRGRDRFMVCRASIPVGQLSLPIFSAGTVCVCLTSRLASANQGFLCRAVCVCVCVCVDLSTRSSQSRFSVRGSVCVCVCVCADLSTRSSQSEGRCLFRRFHRGRPSRYRATMNSQCAQVWPPGKG